MQRMQHAVSIKRAFLTMAFGLSVSACSSIPNSHTVPIADNRWSPVAQSKHTEQLEQLLSAEFALQRQGSESATTLYLDLAEQSTDVEIAKRDTSTAMMSEDSQAVLKASSRWLTLDPSASQAYPILMQAQLSIGALDEAKALLLKAKKNDIPLSFLPSFVDQNIRHDRITTHLENLLSDPKLASDLFVNIALLHVHFINGKYQYILDNISPLFELSPETEQEGLFIIKAVSEEQLGIKESAQNTLKQGLKSFPKSQRLMANYLEILVKNDQYQTALSAFDEAQLNPYLQQQIGTAIAQLLMQKKQPELAIQLISKLPKHGGLRDDLLFILANAQHQAERYNDALKSLLNVFGKLSWEASNLLVQWLYSADQADQVNSFILKRAVVDVEPGHITGVADLHLHNQRPDLAIDLLTRALPIFPDADGLRYKRAITYDMQQQWSQALQDLTILYQKHPNDPSYINALGYTMMVRYPDQFDQAFKLIQKAYDLNSEDAAIMDSMGWAYYLQGNLEQAETLLSQSWDTMQDAEIGAHYGEVLWQLEDRENAIKIWRQALRNNSELPVLLETLEQYAPTLLGS
ncbi:MAG: hypothetical protein KC467_02120 [Marinomonas atlantica]|nr:hypothetical protein [Marinomonas atlantica]